MKAIAFVAILASTLIASGCATAGTPMMSGDAPLPPLGDETTIEVHNHNWSDMVVYAVHYNTRIRLGMVTSMNSERFTIPTSLEYSANLQLLASPIGSRDQFRTGPIYVVPGQNVELRLENSLSISNWSVW